MSGYAKLFSSILDSTIWRESDHVRLVWITMIAMADKNSVVEASIPGLADRAKVSVENCEDALKRLKAPDKYSRTQEHEGRRIEDVEGGWFLFNHGKYRDLVTIQEKRKQDAERARRYRERKKRKQEQKKNENVTNNVTANASREITSPSPSPSPPPSPTKDNLTVTNNQQVKDNSVVSKEPDLLTGLAPVTPRKRKKSKFPSGYGKLVWEAYSESYNKRYGTYPVRNAKQNKMCCELRERLGEKDSVEVARYYPSTNNGYHVSRGHALAMLLSDAEKIWTEWKTGRQITQAQARESDRLQKAGTGWQRLIDQAKEQSK
jgi:hypothetical protein